MKNDLVLNQDQLNVLKNYIYGATFLHLTEGVDRNAINVPMNAINALQYAEDTLQVVIGFLSGSRELDGGCSDFQCNIALEAKNTVLTWGSDLVGDRRRGDGGTVLADPQILYEIPLSRQG